MHELCFITSFLVGVMSIVTIGMYSVYGEELYYEKDATVGNGIGRFVEYS